MCRPERAVEVRCACAMHAAVMPRSKSCVVDVRVRRRVGKPREAAPTLALSPRAVPKVGAETKDKRSLRGGVKRCEGVAANARRRPAPKTNQGRG